MSINKDAILTAVEAAGRINKDGRVNTVIDDARSLYQFINSVREEKARLHTNQFQNPPEPIAAQDK